jgi:2-methylcitrate dehydratase
LNALLANGCFVRVLDLNDYVGGAADSGPHFGGHPSDNVPVALAVGEVQGSSGIEILQSIVLGYEIFGRLKSLMDPASSWDEVTVSGLVAPAIAGWLMRLDEETIAHGLALGAARAPTPAIVRSGHVSAAKSIANALVAQSGLQGLLLAAKGATGPLAVLDASRGLQALFPHTENVETLSAPLPDGLYIMRAHVKMYPCLATGQSAVAAALKLHESTKGAIDGLERIEIAMADYPIVRRQQQDPGRIRPMSREAADHSFTFLVAAPLLDGVFGMKQYENERWLQPDVTALMEKLVMTTDPGWAERAPGSYPCALRAYFADGRELVSEVPFPPGFSRNGLERRAVIEKFHAVTGDHLSHSRRERVVEAVLALDEGTASSAALMAALRP